MVSQPPPPPESSYVQQGKDILELGNKINDAGEELKKRSDQEDEADKAVTARNQPTTSPGGGDDKTERDCAEEFEKSG